VFVGFVNSDSAHLLIETLAFMELKIN